MEKLQIRLSRHVFAPSHYIRAKISNDLHKEISVLPTPFYNEVSESQLDESLYQERLKGKQYLLFYSKLLSDHKGTFVLAQALPKVFKARPNLVAVVIGANTYPDPGQSQTLPRQRFLELCGEFSERIIFFDALPHAQLYPIIQNAHLVVLPSYVENLSNACLEAIGLGLPVVATRGRSSDEIIEDRVSGFLAEPGDPEDLNRVILEALTSFDLEKVGQAARQRAQDFSPENTLPALIDYYRQVIAEA
jgi:glycosyltransferase involved in cell wall biosynthesis